MLSPSVYVCIGWRVCNSCYKIIPFCSASLSLIHSLSFSLSFGCSVYLAMNFSECNLAPAPAVHAARYFIRVRRFRSLAPSHSLVRQRKGGGDWLHMCRLKLCLPFAKGERERRWGLCKSTKEMTERVRKSSKPPEWDGVQCRKRKHPPAQPPNV